MLTTVTISDHLVAEVDALVGYKGIAARNQLIVEALQNWVELKTEAPIDNKLAMIEENNNHIAETIALQLGFSQNDLKLTNFNDD